jgi:hypothetical protein
VANNQKMTQKEIATAITDAPKKGLILLLDALKNCPKTVRALATKSRKEEAQRELQKKKDRRLDLLCL